MKKNRRIVIINVMSWKPKDKNITRDSSFL